MIGAGSDPLQTLTSGLTISGALFHPLAASYPTIDRSCDRDCDRRPFYWASPCMHYTSHLLGLTAAGLAGAGLRFCQVSIQQAKLKFPGVSVWWLRVRMKVMNYTSCDHATGVSSSQILLHKRRSGHQAVMSL